MNRPPKPLFIARTDESDRFVRLPEPLADLQQRCGGEQAGVVAIPEMLMLTRKARTIGLTLARRWSAFDGECTIVARSEFVPLVDDDTLTDIGCEIRVTAWHHSEPAYVSDIEEPADIAGASLIPLADLHLMLDGNRKIVMAASKAEDCRKAASSMNEQKGEDWTRFVELPPGLDRPGLHWRLLDGAQVGLPGSERRFEVMFEPNGSVEHPTSFTVSFLGLTKEALPEPSDINPDADIDLDALLSRLREPGRKIAANTDFMMNGLAGPLSGDFLKYAQDIHEAAHHFTAIVEGLGSVESDTQGTDHLDLAQIARKAASLLDQNARARELRIVTPARGERLTVKGDARKALQIVLNLLNNAIAYSPVGSQVWLRLDQDGGFGTLTVADQGAGLDAEQQKRVFEKFERLGRAGDGGTGLGLAIARRLALDMDGNLNVESAPGQGARFILSLPRVGKNQ